MKKNELLEKVFTGVPDEELRNELLRSLFGIRARREQGIPQLREHGRSLDYNGIHRRMTTVAGGTGVRIAQLLGISPQAYNNEKQRGMISARNILRMHLKTGVSMDWLLGSWEGSESEYVTLKPSYEPSIENTFPIQNYLSLVEIYDQTSGRTELKWCLTKRQVCLDDEGNLIPEDYGALLALITRYKYEAGTPERVKSGGKHLYQARRVIAYILGDPKMIRKIDHKAKKMTLDFRSDEIERTGKTEFRKITSKDVCINVLETLANMYHFRVVTPEFDTIPWDFLIGKGSISPKMWILNKLKEHRNKSGHN